VVYQNKANVIAIGDMPLAGYADASVNACRTSPPSIARQRGEGQSAERTMGSAQILCINGDMKNDTRNAQRRRAMVLIDGYRGFH
jgi:hypothetical protein